jgi:hypothetical protein
MCLRRFISIDSHFPDLGDCEWVDVKVVETPDGFLAQPDDPYTPFLAGPAGRYYIVPLAGGDSR